MRWNWNIFIFKGWQKSNDFWRNLYFVFCLKSEYTWNVALIKKLFSKFLKGRCYRKIWKNISLSLRNKYSISLFHYNFTNTFLYFAYFGYQNQLTYYELQSTNHDVWISLKKKRICLDANNWLKQKQNYTTDVLVQKKSDTNTTGNPCLTVRNKIFSLT